MSLKGSTKLLFPLGNMKKDDVRTLARMIGFAVAQKPDSQEICFIDTDYRDFLEKNGINEKKGLITLENGESVGEHNGIHTLTIGQRKGMGFSSEEKKYVKTIISEENRIVVGNYEELFSNGLTASKINLLVSEEEIRLLEGEKLFCRIRSRDNSSESRFKLSEQKMTVYFEKPLFAVTPGQLCVLYKGSKAVISGFIDSSFIS